MKKVKTEADLLSLSARMGAPVELAGRVYNATGTRGHLRAVAPAEVPPVVIEPPDEPEQKPTIVQLDMGSLAETIKAQGDATNESLRQMGEMVAASLPKNNDGTSPRDWNIKVTYDSMGRITNISAKAS
jgi:hypothetical protein